MKSEIRVETGFPVAKAGEVFLGSYVDDVLVGFGGRSRGRAGPNVTHVLDLRGALGEDRPRCA